MDEDTVYTNDSEDYFFSVEPWSDSDKYYLDEEQSLIINE